MLCKNIIILVKTSNTHPQKGSSQSLPLAEQIVGRILKNDSSTELVERINFDRSLTDNFFIRKVFIINTKILHFSVTILEINN